MHELLRSVTVSQRGKTLKLLSSQAEQRLCIVMKMLPYQDDTVL